jgi:CheY-like chemotaxis protein
VITDLIMEGMSGLDVIQTLREEFRGVKIIGISGGASDFPPVERMRGANRVFSKPIDRDALLKTVREMVSPKDT